MSLPDLQLSPDPNSRSNVAALPGVVKATFELTAECVAKLESLAERFRLTPAVTLEFLVRDRASVSDLHKNKERRNAHWKEWAESNAPPPGGVTLERAGKMSAYMAGYAHAWLDFQTRHGEDVFILEL